MLRSTDAKEHRCHLHLLFRRLPDHGLVVNVTKCTLGVGVGIINFLGHPVTSRGGELLLEQVEAICQFPQPQNAKAVSEFLGMVNFYHEPIARFG